MALSLATMAAATKAWDLDGVQLFSLEPSAVEMAHTLSMCDWRDWLPLAQAPYTDSLIDWDPRVYAGMRNDGAPRLPYTQNYLDKMIPRIGILTEAGGASLIMEGDKHSAIPSPFALVWDPARGPSLDGDLEDLNKRFAEIAWGPGWVRKYGVPPAPAVLMSGQGVYGKLGALAAWRMAEECAGQVRVALAALALLNVERASIAVQASYRDGRTVLRNRTVPRYRPTVVVIRPDAVRRIYTRSEDAEPTGIRKKEHDVRQHFRTLADGRRVRVRAHQRGDPALGRVEKRYLVEHSPEVIMPVEPPPLLD